jgi:hypothetical protein
LGHSGLDPLVAAALGSGEAEERPGHEATSTRLCGKTPRCPDARAEARIASAASCLRDVNGGDPLVRFHLDGPGTSSGEPVYRQHQNRRRSLVRKSLIIAAVVALACASTAFAGGWATVKLNSSPKGLTADEPWVVDITVLQHGLASQPLCCLKPTVTIRRVAPVRSTSAVQKKSLTFNARPTSRTGVYRAKVVFPSAGTWRYEVFDAFTAYGGARTHTFKAVKISASNT